MKKDLTLNLQGSETPQVQTNTVPVQPTIQPLATNPTNTNQQIPADFATQIAQAMMMMQQQTQAQHQQAHVAAQAEKDMRSLDLSGVASQSFTEQMQQEIKDNKYMDFMYYPALAKKFGKKLSFGVSGYNIVLMEGKTTRIPQSLVAALNIRIGGANIMDVMLRDKIVGFANKGDVSTDPDVTAEALGVINQALPSK